MARMSRLAASWAWSCRSSFFERANNAYFNSLAMIDADGGCSGSTARATSRTGPGYQEKYYFNPGDTGFRSGRPSRLHRRRHVLGPVVPRGRAGDGTDGRGSAALPGRDRLRAAAIRLRRRRPLAAVMQGHAAANMVPVVGVQPGRAREGEQLRRDFYGSSFIADDTGEIVREAPTQRRGGHDRVVRSRALARHGPPGACSATGDPTSTCRS